MKGHHQKELPKPTNQQTNQPNNKQQRNLLKRKQSKESYHSRSISTQKNKHIEVEPEVIKQNKNTLLSYICQDSNGNLPLNNDSSSLLMNYAQILKSYNPSETIHKMIEMKPLKLL